MMRKFINLFLWFGVFEFIICGTYGMSANSENNIYIRELDTDLNHLVINSKTGNVSNSHPFEQATRRRQAVF